MLTLVLGGMRSGKSAFAVRLAERTGRPVTYLATGVATDAEMDRRIDLHKRGRNPDWTVVEEPLSIGSAVSPRQDVVLLDSVDSWLANRMEEAGGAGVIGGAQEELISACSHELTALEGSVNQVIAVSSEVGMSLVPTTRYGRAFADALGLLNQRLSAVAAEVHLVVAGIPVRLDAEGGSR
jgi:adenosylcobinamide kinase / adenosylcobinamide-phosphate guanylyltransferase